MSRVDNFLDDAPLGALLVRVAKTHRRWVGVALADLGLHVGQEILLIHLCRQEGIRQTALAQALDVELPTVSKALARLEAAGFVQRRPDPSDARSSLAFLTEQGRAACESIREIWQAADRRLSAALLPQDAARLRGLLDDLASQLGRD